MPKLLYNFAKIILLIVLPFILLVRGSVYIHDHYAYMPWLSLLGGILMTGIILFIYLTSLYGNITGRFGASGVLLRRSILSFFLVLGYCAYGLIYISNSNIQKQEVLKEYSQLHPILRLGVSTVVFIDKSLLITDAARMPEDYRKMGLPTKKRSLHYKQSNGFAHAIDIRTKGRSEFRNQLLKVYFQLMGFQTLRHVGTADHLHVSLKSHDTPGAL